MYISPTGELTASLAERLTLSQRVLYLRVATFGLETSLPCTATRMHPFLIYSDQSSWGGGGRIERCWASLYSLPVMHPTNIQHTTVHAQCFIVIMPSEIHLEWVKFEKKLCITSKKRIYAPFVPHCFIQ